MGAPRLRPTIGSTACVRQLDVQDYLTGLVFMSFKLSEQLRRLVADSKRPPNQRRPSDQQQKARSNEGHADVGPELAPEILGKEPRRKRRAAHGNSEYAH